MATGWRTVRVFISSTFLDMQAERDHLVRFVFPRLREELLKRRIHFVDVDLRWGVTSEQDALAVCREIIDECRPRFLCMLGGRYGWTPEGRDHSITADEVRYAALGAARQPHRFFYFRDPGATAAMVEEHPGQYREPPGSPTEERLAWLKKSICDAGYTPVVYPARWDAAQRRLAGLEAFGQRVYDELLASINDEFGTEPPAPLDEFAEEAAAMEAFIEERTARYVVGSRQPLLDDMARFVAADGSPNILLLTGAPGSGKSALLAHFAHTLSQSAIRNPQSAIAHFVGASPGSTDLRRTLRRLCHELQVITGATEPIPLSVDELIPRFSALLEQAAASHRLILLLDALNQMDPADGAHTLRWLPRTLPPNIRIVISCLAGPVVEALRFRRGQVREEALGPLTAQDSGAIATAFARRYRKTLDRAQLDALLSKPESASPLYLLVALEQLRTLGTYEEITDCIRQLPGDTRSLFLWILKDRLSNDPGFHDAEGNLVGAELVRRFVSYLGVSRHGLSQREIADLVDPGDPWGNVAALLRLLRPYLMVRGELLDFYHGQLREAVEVKYLDIREERLAAHRRLAAFFTARQISPRKLAELPWQLQRAEEWTQLRDCLVDFDMFVGLDERDRSELLRYWLSIWDRFDMVQEYRLALERERAALGKPSLVSSLWCLVRRVFGRAGTIEERRGLVAHSLLLKRLSAFLVDAGKLDAAEELSQRTETIRKSVYGRSYEDAAELCMHGEVAMQSGNNARALSLYRRALEIYQAEEGLDHEHVAIVLHNMAVLFCQMGNLMGGEQCCRRALGIRERCCGENHPDVAQSLNVLGLVLQKQRKLAEAEDSFRRALAIRERCLPPLHPNVAQSVSNLAVVLHDRGELNEAESLLRRALELRQRALPPEHPDLANSYFNMAALLFASGNPREAGPLANRALAILVRTRGESHPETCQARDLVARIHPQTGLQSPATG